MEATFRETKKVSRPIRPERQRFSVHIQHHCISPRLRPANYCPVSSCGVCGQWGPGWAMGSVVALGRTVTVIFHETCAVWLLSIHQNYQYKYLSPCDILVL